MTSRDLDEEREASRTDGVAVTRSMDLAREARVAVRRLVEDLVGRDDSPLAIVDTSKQVASQAEACFRQVVSDARASAFSWGEIASAIPAFERLGEDGPTELFETVAADGAFAPVLHWRCPACEAVVLDRGPWDSHPSDMERGHAGGCPRQLRQIAAHEARWSQD